MSLKPPAPVTADGDLNILDRAGVAVPLNLTKNGSVYNPAASSLSFEAKTFTKVLEANGTGYILRLTAADLTQLSALAATRFALLDRSVSPPDIIWEGLLFIRSVN